MARLDLGNPELAIMGGQPAGPDILLQMGLDCACGRHGETDLVSAHKWFNLAAMKGNAQAVHHRRDIADEMSRAEIAEAQRAAREWLSLN
jgi:TPR repeat protein